MQNRSVLFGFFFLFPYLSFAASSASDSTVVLSPIVVEGASTDALLFDPIVPTTEQTLGTGSASGSVARSMEEQLPTPFTDYGLPGITTQFRGIGRTVDETNVQALGVPLNSIQGGGFDFGSFPQFVWSKYQYHLGPSTGAFDPGAPSGTLSLTPWTAQAINDRKLSDRVTELVTRGLNQTSVAASYDGVAILGGYSAINAQGPSGSFSALLIKDENWDVRAHFLGTSLIETSPGSITAPSPHAQFETARFIPVLQLTRTISDQAQLRETVFYDRSYIRFENPDDSSFDSYDRSNQFGSETVLLLGDWTLGQSIRRTSFEIIGFEAPNEWITHTQVGRNFRLGQATLSARADVDGVSQEGFHPGGELGGRFDFSDQFDLFSKVNFSYRFPSYVDRYEQVPFFTPNPQLGPEQALSLNLGAEMHGSEFKTSVQGFLQWRANSQVYTGSTVDNEGNAQELSLIEDLSWQARPWLDVVNSLRLSHSRVDATQSAIPYDPLATEILSLRVHDESDAPLWSTGVSIRALSQSTSGYGTDPGYGFVDLEANLNLKSGLGRLTVQGRVEDLMNRPIQVVQGYPWPGRLFALSLIGSI